MTRRRKMYAAALSVLILTTASASALLCRGHSPSRFATSNLPFWERTLPHPVPPCVALRGSPLLPDDGGRSLARLAQTNSDDLFAALEHPAHERAGRAGAGDPGLWLLAACAADHPTPDLRRERDAVAVRLMEAQHGDGYLADGAGPGRWSRGQADALGQNLSGLLAYYAVSHSPASIHAAMLAGDLVVTQLPSVKAAPVGASSLVLPLTLLYQATGEQRYRRWADGHAGDADGPGLCALYAATGKGRYLQDARRVWSREYACRRLDPDLTASLWVLTGNRKYRAALHTLTAFDPCPIIPGGLRGAKPLGALHVSAVWHGAVNPPPLAQHVPNRPHQRGG